MVMSTSTNLVSVFTLREQGCYWPNIKSEMNSPTTPASQEIALSVSTRHSVWGQTFSFSLSIFLSMCTRVCLCGPIYIHMYMYGPKYGYSQGLCKGFADDTFLESSWKKAWWMSQVGVSKIPAFQPLFCGMIIS